MSLGTRKTNHSSSLITERGEALLACRMVEGAMHRQLCRGTQTSTTCILKITLYASSSLPAFAFA